MTRLAAFITIDIEDRMGILRRILCASDDGHINDQTDVLRKSQSFWIRFFHASFWIINPIFRTSSTANSHVSPNTCIAMARISRSRSARRSVSVTTYSNDQSCGAAAMRVASAGRTSARTMAGSLWDRKKPGTLSHHACKPRPGGVRTSPRSVQLQKTAD